MRRVLYMFVIGVLLLAVPGIVEGQDKVRITGSKGEAITPAGGALPVTGTFGLPVDAATAQELQRLLLVDIEADTTTIAGDTTSIDLKTPALIGGKVPVDAVGTVAVSGVAGTVAVDGSGHTQPVSGTFWQGTQPVSGTVAVSGVGGTTTVDGTVAVSGVGGTTTVDGTVAVSGVGGTTAVSAAALPLPAGAATFAGQLPDDHNVTISNASIPVTGTFYPVTQPVSGTVTANAGTNLNTSALATEATAGVIAGDTTSIDDKTPALIDAMVPVIQHDMVVAVGGAAGHAPIWKFGYDGDVGAAWELVSELSAVYDYLDAEETFVIKSDSVEDDTDKGGAVAGTGAFTVEVYCTNQAWAQVVQTVTLNGTAAVSLSTADCMIAYRMRVMSTGTGGYGVGTITLYQNDGATAQLSVTPGNNQSQIAHLPVPDATTLYVSYINVSDVSSKVTQIGIFVKEFGLPWQLKQPYSVTNSVVNRPFRVNFTVPAKAIIAVRARTTGAAGVVSVNFDAVFVDD